jgi:hypothetical protein
MKHSLQDILNKDEIRVEALVPAPLLRDEIQFFVEMLRSPNLSKETAAAINETIRILVSRYANPMLVMKDVNK